MSSSMNNYLSGLGIGEITISDNLALVSLFHTENAPPDYITLDYGVKEGLLEIYELEEGAQVNTIGIANRSDKPALLFEGEELLGAMQNRILNVSTLIPAKSKQELPVSCVEAGRWHHTESRRERRAFRVADRIHFASGRARENMAVSRNLDSARSYRGDQSEVWSSIEDMSDRLSAASPTSASDAMYKKAETTIEDHVRSL